METPDWTPREVIRSLIGVARDAGALVLAKVDEWMADYGDE